MRISPLSLSIPAFVALAIAGAPARAATDPTPVLRCIYASAALGQNPDPKAKQASSASGLFWLGRLDPALTEADITRRMAEIAAKATAPVLQADIKRCVAELESKGALMNRVGASLRQKATVQPGGAKSQ